MRGREAAVKDMMSRRYGEKVVVDIMARSDDALRHFTAGKLRHAVTIVTPDAIRR